MHKEEDITIDNLCKIEGEASLDIKIRNNKIEKAELKITQNKRFYTESIMGKIYSVVPPSVSRICGTCSTSHVLASIKAIENAYNIKVSKQTKILRELSMHGQLIRDHAMHLYLFVLPDMLGKESVFDFTKEHKELIHKAFHIKNAGTLVSKYSAGRAVHPTFPTIGGHLNIGTEEQKHKAMEELEKYREDALNFIQYFKNPDFEFSRDTEYLSLCNQKYDFLSGDVLHSKEGLIKVCDLKTHLTNLVVPYSQSDVFELNQKEYITGALARINTNRKYLHKNTKKDVSEYLKIFPSTNIFDNNIAQAIEVIHSIDKSLEILENNNFEKEEIIRPEIKEDVEGVGAIEAPRGTLYYHINLDKTGKVKYADLVIPTAQNQIKMQNDIKEYATDLLKKNYSRSKIEKHIEALIRAYDPCMSCGSNFLKIRWNES